MRYQLEVALGAPGAVRLLLCCVVAAVVLFAPLARVFGWRPGWTLLALLSLAPVLTFTVPVGALEPSAGALGRALEFVGTFRHPYELDAELQAAGSDDERLANLLLFVPAGILGTLATRRAGWTALGGVVLSFVIESWQAVSGVRVATVADWLHNSAGVILGASLGVALVVASRWVSSACAPEPRAMRPASHEDDATAPRSWAVPAR